MILNSLFPVFGLILLGGCLKRWGLTDDRFLKTSDRLVYFIFFPAMLFWKIGGKPMDAVVPWNFCAAVLLSVVGIYLLSAICIKLFGITDFEAGSFSQSCYRFNSYIGIAIIFNSLGEPGVVQFGILIGFIIPIINLLAVSTLIWFSGKKVAVTERFRIIIAALVSNPLILACIAGILYARFIRTFPEFIDNTFRLMSLVTLPLALLSIGGALTFNTLKRCFKASLAASVLKLVVLPTLGWFLLKGFAIEGIHLKIGMIFFCLPASTAIYVLSSQLSSDTDLASASIVLSTILSFLSLSLAMVLFF